MKRLMAAVVACLSLGASALAHEPVRRDFLPESAGFSENPLVEGRATFRYDSCDQETRLRVNIDGLLPNTTYGVRWESDGPILDNPLGFTTDCEGEGRYTDYLLGDASADPVLIIYINDPINGDIYGYDVGEERAVSFLPFTRIRVFDPVGLGTLENACVEGMAEARFYEGTFETRFKLVMKELRPFTTYGVKFECENGPTLDNSAAFTTNRRGNGKYDDYLLGVATRNVVITVYINDDPMGDPFGLDPGEERARGEADH